VTEKKSEVTWESPPPIGQGRYDWAVISEKLKTQPGEWAKVFDHDKTSIVNAIRQGKIKVIRPELGFQIRTSNNVRRPVRTCSLYLRYNPDSAPKTPVPVKKKTTRKKAT
jgi:hypothetical protein